MEITTIITGIKVIAFIIFGIACVAIYHNTNSFEPAKRIGYIVVRNIHNVSDKHSNFRTKHIRYNSNKSISYTRCKISNTNNNKIHIHPNKCDASIKCIG